MQKAKNTNNVTAVGVIFTRGVCVCARACACGFHSLRHALVVGMVSRNAQVIKGKNSWSGGRLR